MVKKKTLGFFGGIYIKSNDTTMETKIASENLSNQIATSGHFSKRAC